jgi:hypothetical protein
VPDRQAPCHPHVAACAWTGVRQTDRQTLTAPCGSKKPGPAQLREAPKREHSVLFVMHNRFFWSLFGSHSQDPHFSRAARGPAHRHGASDGQTPACCPSTACVSPQVEARKRTAKGGKGGKAGEREQTPFQRYLSVKEFWTGLPREKRRQMLAVPVRDLLEGGCAALRGAAILRHGDQFDDLPRRQRWPWAKQACLAFGILPRRRCARWRYCSPRWQPTPEDRRPTGAPCLDR